ncbi:MAG: GNAT family protein [Pseudomonadota bacterium]
MELSASELENDLLRLEPISSEHRDLIFASDVEASIWKWMPALPGGTSLAHYFDFVLKAQTAGVAATFVLFQKSDGAFAGLTGFNDINKIHRRVRNALAWHPPDLATERLYLAGQHAMITRAFDWRAKRLEWQVNTNNDYILSQLSVIGLTQEAVFRNFERTADGVWVDKIVFALTRAEMPNAIQRLEQALN